MKKRFGKLALLSAVLFAAAPAFAQSVDDKIKMLEQELTALKTQQIELKKEATAAAAALPTFEYRPGNGLNIEAADKSWGVRFTLESHFRYNFEAGRDQMGRSQGELMGRRFRPGIYLLREQLSVGDRSDAGSRRLGNGQRQERDRLPISVRSCSVAR